jgi:tetratricopeptide (TPR) repeat protein
LGLIAENEKKYELAVNYFSKAIYYDSSYFPAYVNLISLHVNNDYLDRSLKILDYLETQKIDPETDLLKNYFFAYINLVKGNCELARKYISKTNNVNYFKQYEANIQTLKNSIDNCLLKKY